VKTFDASGRLKSEIRAWRRATSRHRHDWRSTAAHALLQRTGALTVATADRRHQQRRRLAGAADRQCGGHARGAGAGSRAAPKLEIRGEFLHAYLDQER
jgi:ferric-dicitrate binding protein FerR (iron transport regulator)